MLCNMPSYQCSDLRSLDTTPVSPWPQFSLELSEEPQMDKDTLSEFSQLSYLLSFDRVVLSHPGPSLLMIQHLLIQVSHN